MASEFPSVLPSSASPPKLWDITSIPHRGTSKVTEVSEFILRRAIDPRRYGEFPSDRRGIARVHPLQHPTDAAAEATSDDEIIAWARDGLEARAEILSERLELAIDEILATRLQDRVNDLAAKRDLLFDLYEREILTRDQVRVRVSLDPSDFYEELRAYRQRRAAR